MLLTAAASAATASNGTRIRSALIIRFYEPCQKRDGRGAFASCCLYRNKQPESAD